MADISKIKFNGVTYTLKSKNDHLHSNRTVLDKITNKSDNKTYGIKNGDLAEIVGGGDVLYTNTTPTPTVLGGINKGATFNNVNIKQILEDLLYPYIKPIIVSSTAVTYKEKGNVDSNSQNNISINVKKGSKLITNLTIRVITGETTNTYSSDSLISSLNSLSSGDSVTLNFPYTLTTDGENTTNVYLDVKDEKLTVVTKAIQTYNFIYKTYYGVISNESEVTDVKIKQLTSLITAKGDKKLSYSGENIIPVYAYPSSYGSLSKIIDDNGFDVTGTFNTTTLSITNGYNKTTTYNVYYLASAATLNNFAFNFKF